MALSACPGLFVSARAACRSVMAMALAVAVGPDLLGAGQAPKVAPLAASGGDVVFDMVADGDISYRVHVFTNTGPAMLTISNSGFADCLIVGGGGGGGETIGGGGGGGGVLEYHGVRVTAGDYAVTVGAGGAGGWGSSYPAGTRGSASQFGGWTAIGGGAGAGYSIAASGTGGSAGGNGGGGGARAGYTPGQGSDGGIHWNNNAGGGGGGAGATGTGASAAGGGNGGDGRASAITGATIYYSGGGGGGTRNTTGPEPGTGGLGGGGDGGRTTMGQEGTATTGGGGGGGGFVGELAGGRGGSGIVIVRYSLAPMTPATPVTLADPATGSEDFTNTNGVRIIDIPAYAGYDQFQCTGENRSVTALDPDGWIPTNNLSSFYATFAPPVADTNITLYVWFTNATDTAMPLLRSPGSMAFTSAKPVPALRALTRYLVEGASTVAVEFADLDSGTTGGTTGETPIPIFGYGLACANDITPNAPELTFNQVGIFDIVLTVTNAAGNVAATTNQIDIQQRTLNLYVSHDGDNTGAPNWSGAYTNIQTAMDAAVEGDTIHLAGELYGVTNQIDWTTSGITIRGGYEATETDPAKLPGTNNPARWPTVIARLSGTTRLVYINGVSNSTLEQVTLTGGNADTGNGLRINNCLNVRLSGCSITNNVSTGSGTAGRGGGIYAIASGLTLTNCVVSGNRVNLSTPSSSSVYGGGIYSEGGSLTLYDSKILNNDATCWFNSRGDGGGVYCSGTVRMKNVLLAGNLANRYGGGICVIGGTASLENCTIADNLETGIQRTGGTVSLINSIVWGHPNDIVGTSITVSYSALGVAGYDGVNGNIGADPLFEYGYHLAAGSPCIGKGSDSAGNLGLTTYTTRTDGAPYATGDATVTMGYHQMPGTVFDRTYADVYVSLAGDDSNSGTLVLSPFRTMTQALAVAQDGTRIHVSTGRYVRAVGVTAGEAFPLMLDNRVGVQIIGTDAAQTVFDALGSGARVMDLICAHRVEMSGVTITGGSVAYGAGLRVDRSLGVSLSGVTISDNVYYSNSGGAGGGIWAQSSAMTLGDCTVRSNSVTAWTTASSRAFGGGVWFRYGRLTMRNCSIVGNTAYNRPPGWAYGGGVHRDGNAVLDLRNVLFAGNSVAGAPTADHGSGLYTAGGGSVLMENCTVTDNTLGGIRCDGSVFTLLNSIVWGNGTYDLSGTYTAVRFSDVGTAGYAGVNGTISSDPIFKDAVTDDFRLLLGSPAIDKGQSQDWMDDAVDLDGNSRVSMAGVDMGAFELPAPAGTVILIR